MTHLEGLLSAHLDGEVSPTEADRIERHLASCEECRLELEAVARARSVVRSLPSLDPPGGMVPPLRRRARWVWAASGIAAAALAIGLVWAPGEPTPQMDLDVLADRHTARVIVDPGISAIRGPTGGR